MPRLPSSRRGKKKVAPKDGPSGHQSSPHTFPHHPGVGLALPRLTGGRKHQIYKTHQCLPCCARRDLELDRCRDPTQTTRRILKQFPIFVAASLSLDLVCHPKFFAFVLVVSTCTESADLYHLEFPPNFAIGCGTETASMMASSPTYSCSGSSGSSNCSWQERLEDFCQKAQLTSPIFHIVSDRRGGRTAWSSRVTVYGQTLAARYWYDGKNLNNAREDAAERAFLWLVTATGQSNSQLCGSW